MRVLLPRLAGWHCYEVQPHLHVHLFSGAEALQQRCDRRRSARDHADDAKHITSDDAEATERREDAVQRQECRGGLRVRSLIHLPAVLLRQTKHVLPILQLFYEGRDHGGVAVLFRLPAVRKNEPHPSGCPASNPM